ncbi:MAG: WbqC family protein [FCB group bacterium]|jgi:hypothetical protein|nr:WbqC family protein [FCB group bacterium]
MIVAALQPGYLPWAGYFNLMKRADLFVIEDSLQYTKQDWRNRNRIRTREGSALLTVPVRKGAVTDRINEVLIDNRQPWGRRHWSLIEQNYAKAPFWVQYKEFLRESYAREWDRLVDLDVWFAAFLAEAFGIRTPVRLLSEIPVVFGPDKTKSLVDLTRAVGADAFLEGSSGQDFIEPRQFEAAGLGIVFQEYECRPYRQRYEPFVSHLSALDLLLNEGPEGGALI